MSVIKKDDSKKFVFTSKNINNITNQINDGYVIKRYQNPWFKNEVGVRRNGITFALTDDELQEYIKCKLDIHYFAEKYCKVKTEDGSIDNITLRDYQREILDMFSGRFSILNASRQIGKTINAAITMLHFVTFNNDKNIMIVANIAGTTIEIIDKIKSIYVNLPFFLKVGIKNWNQKTIIFDNGCRIKSAARSKTPAIGFTIDFLYLDEFAHIPSNIINPYYTAVYPVVSAIENSKIIITSTPNGMNLFYKLLTDAERSPGDPLKNSYRAMRIYWYQVPGRFVTYYRLNTHKMHEYLISKEEILSQIENEFGTITNTEVKYNADIQKDVVYIYNNEFCTEQLTKSFKFIDKDGIEVPIQAIAEVTTWKEEATKDIGGEDAFNQEYGLRFINSSRSLLDEGTIEGLLKNKKLYEFEQIYEFDRKLKFSYKDLKWIKDDDVFTPVQRKTIRGVMSIDISEGLGQDYSVINIFKLSSKSKDIIELQKHMYTNISDFFCLEQIGLFRSNIVSVKQLSEIFYLLAFEYFNFDNFKVVLELNTYGSEFLAHLPHVFEGSNNYGSSIFFKYKHRSDALEEKIGLKIGDNKNLLVKEYQDAMDKKNFLITNEDNIREITTFVKHITPSGNIRYAADVGSDDCLKPGTLIKTDIGYIPIEDIKIGDMVLTHLGNYKPITNICIKEFNGDMYRMKFSSQLELNLTYNHPLYSAKLDHQSNNFKYGKRDFKIREWKLPNEWDKKYNQISIKEKLGKNKNIILQYSDIFTKSIFMAESNIKLKSIIMDSDFAKFLGLFLADGNCYKPKNDVYKLSIAFNKNDINLINWVKYYLNKLNLKFYERKYKEDVNSFVIEFNNKTLYELLKHCYNDRKEKILPKFANNLGEDLSYVLQYWIKGDGWIIKKVGNRKERVSGCSVSRQLALSMRDIAISIGKYATIEKRIRYRHGKKTKDQYWVTIYNERPNGGSMFYFSDFEYGSKIRNIEKYTYDGLTYNLEVKDDNSYIAEGIVVHNCAMVLVNASSIFAKHEFRQMCEDYSSSIDKDLLNYFNLILKNIDYTEISDYSSIIKVNKQRKMLKQYKEHVMNNGNTWFGGKFGNIF